MKFNTKDLLLLLAFLLVSLAASAQSYINLDGQRFRTYTDFKVDRRFQDDTIPVIRVVTRDSTAGGYMLINGKDTSVSYQSRDTMFHVTTARAHKFIPALPCCGDTCLFEVGLGANSVQDKRSPNGAQGDETTVVGITNFVDSTCFQSTVVGFQNAIYDTCYQSNIFGFENYIYDTCYRSSILGYNNSIWGTSYRSTATGFGNAIYSNCYQSGVFGYANTIFNNSFQSIALGTFSTITESRQSIVIGDSAIINNKPKSIALGIRATPTDSNQLAISDSIKTVLLKLNVATAGAGSVLTVDANGIATWSNRTLSGSATLNFGSIGNHNYEDLTVTVTGASVGDVVSIGAPNGSVPANASFFAWVSDTNMVTVRCFNINSGSIDPASGTFKIKVFK